VPAAKTMPVSAAQPPARVPGIVYTGPAPQSGADRFSALKRSRLKRWLLASLALTACAALAAAFFLSPVSFLSGSPDNRCLFGLYNPLENLTYLYSGGKLALTVEGDSNGFCELPKSQRYIVLHGAGGGDYNSCLYRCDGDSLSLITDRCGEYQFSRTRETAAYLSDNTLFLYSAAAGVTEEICTGDGITMRLSDSGSSLLYGNTEGIFVCREGASVLLSDEEFVVLLNVTDDGTAFIMTMDDELIRFSGGERTVVSDDFDLMDCFCLFNKAGDQAIFETKDGVYHYLQGASDPVVIDSLGATTSSIVTVVSGGDNLLDALYYDYMKGDLFYLNADGSSAHIIGKSVYDYVIHDGGILYSFEGKLFEAFGSAYADVREIASGIRGFMWASDGKSTYYGGEENGLYYRNGAGTVTQVCADEILAMDMMSDGTLLFINSDNNLYSCKAGKNVRLIDSAESIWVSDSAAFYYNNKRNVGGTDVYDIYFSTRGTRFKLLAEGVTRFTDLL